MESAERVQILDEEVLFVSPALMHPPREEQESLLPLDMSKMIE